MDAVREHWALVGGAMLGVVAEQRWMQMPMTFDLPAMKRKLAGGIGPGRAEAVAYTRRLIDTAAYKITPDEVPVRPEDEVAVRALLGQAYDMLVEELGASV